MDLPLSLKFEGWTIRYNVLESRNSPEPNCHAKCVVFVHGTPWSSIVFKPTIEALLARGSYQILVYDLPGYGKSQDLDAGSTTTPAGNGFLGDTSVKFQALALAELLKQVQMDGKGNHAAPAVIPLGATRNTLLKSLYGTLKRAPNLAKNTKS